jgi:hypothetical protein
MKKYRNFDRPERYTGKIKFSARQIDSFYSDPLKEVLTYQFKVINAVRMAILKRGIVRRYCSASDPVAVIAYARFYRCRN